MLEAVARQDSHAVWVDRLSIVMALERLDALASLPEEHPGPGADEVDWRGERWRVLPVPVDFPQPYGAEYVVLKPLRPLSAEVPVLPEATDG